MRFNFKTIFLGGVIFYAVAFALSMISGYFIHEGVMDQLYRETSDFWRPELRQDPPDMAALMPRWIAVGLVICFFYAGIYDNIREALAGSAVISGLKFGLLLALFNALCMAGMSGVFDLPEMIWVWWTIDQVYVYAPAGAVLGWYVGKFA